KYEHYSIDKKRIPDISPNKRTEFIDKHDGYADTVDSLQNANYHTVNDEINEYWDPSGMVRDVRIFFDVGYRILNGEKMQRWYEGDEFKQKRLEMLEKAEEK